MRVLVMAAALLVTVVSPAAAQSYGPAPDAATTREILSLREAAWRAWFSNDTAAFMRVVPDELIALGWDGGPWSDRAQTIGQMREFAAGGSTLVTLEFPRNVLQQYGDAIILYTSFRIVLKGTNDAMQETTGRGTEIFVRRKGRWAHTGWHLDAVGS